MAKMINTTLKPEDFSDQERKDFMERFYNKMENHKAYLFKHNAVRGKIAMQMELSMKRQYYAREFDSAEAEFRAALYIANEQGWFSKPKK